MAKINDSKDITPIFLVGTICLDHIPADKLYTANNGKKYLTFVIKSLKEMRINYEKPYSHIITAGKGDHESILGNLIEYKSESNIKKEEEVVPEPVKDEPSLDLYPKEDIPTDDLPW